MTRFASSWKNPPSIGAVTGTRWRSGLCSAFLSGGWQIYGDGVTMRGAPLKRQIGFTMQTTGTNPPLHDNTSRRKPRKGKK